MSTKIHHGYEITEKNLTLAGARELISPFCKAIKDKSSELVAKSLITLAVHAVDSIALGKQPFDSEVNWKDGNDPSIWAADVVNTRYKKIYTEFTRDPEFDFDCHLSLIPYGKRTLALVYAEQGEFWKIWESQPFVKPYPYWNNTDRPEGVTAAEWRARRKAWDEALGSDTPAMRGFTIECIGLQGLDTWAWHERGIPLAPTLEERAHEFALNECIDEHVQKIKKDRAEEEVPIHEIFGLIRQATKWLKNDPEGQKVLAEATKGIAAKLKPVITKEDI